MRACDVYFRPDGLIVTASSRTDTGLWVIDDPVLTLTNDAEPGAIGDAVLAALDGSRTGLPAPEGRPLLLKTLLARARVRTWGAFIKDTQYISIEEIGTGIRVTPHVREGRGYRPQLEDARECRLDAGELGALLVSLRGHG